MGSGASVGLSAAAHGGLINLRCILGMADVDSQAGFHRDDPENGPYAVDFVEHRDCRFYMFRRVHGRLGQNVYTCTQCQ